MPEIVTGCMIFVSVRITPLEEVIESNPGNVICPHMKSDLGMVAMGKGPM